MNIAKVTGFEDRDIPVLNNILANLDNRLSAIDHTTPIADSDETKFNHKIPIVIAGVTYYIMLTTS